jgi:colanic acid/amylovoran biosynthesis protein
MKIIVSHVYSDDNKGDAALLSVLLSDIRRVFSEPQITILTLDKIAENETFDGAPVKNGFMHYASDRYKNHPMRTLYAFFVAAGTLLWALVYKATGENLPLPHYLQDIVLLYRDADLVIPAGGGYIRGKAGFMDTFVLFFMVHPLLFTYILNKPTIGYAQSVGPFGNKIQESLAKFAVKKMTGIIAREKITAELLKKWNIKNVFLSTDAGFLFAEETSMDPRKELGIHKEQMMVGITVRNWLKPEKQAEYERTIAAVADSIVQKYDAAIIFIPQVTVENHRDDDRESSRRVYGFMEHKDSARLLTERYNHQTIKTLCGKLDYLIGTRFHSVIFALTSYVPSIAIGYEYKTQGIMADLGLSDWVIDIERVDPSKLTQLFDQLVAHKSDYVKELRKALPPYIEQAKKSISFVKEIYEQKRAST